MATQQEVAVGYDPIDRIHQAASGTFADVSGAFYEGDESLSLTEAQDRKHRFVFTALGLSKGDTLFDIGCGWGPLLNAARRRGIVGQGITLSPSQVRRCREQRLEVRLEDWKQTRAEPGRGYSGIASLGAFEHFVSPEEMLAGQQERIYRDFFTLCSRLLPHGGRLFLQTMTWGDRVPDPAELDIRAPKLSDRWVMGHLSYLYPGAWLPRGLEQMERCASPHFELTYSSIGRADYLLTMRAWGEAIDRLGWKKWWIMAPHFLRALVDRDRWHLLTALRYGCARLCFERRIFSHYRTVFEKR